ncbi:MAG: cell division protein SepF [Candidatus Margulisiibacteriota bacterium]
MVEGLFKRAKAFIGLEEDEEGMPEAKQMDLSSVLRVPEKRNKAKESSDFEIFIFEPKVYEDSLNISTQLRSGNPVIINLRHLEPSEGTRLVDFVCGTAYAIDGHMTKIGETIFLFSPANIAVSDTEDKGNVAQNLSLGDFPKETFFSR